MAKKIMRNDTITCVVNEDLKIILTNVHETYGHDDSLPFNAQVRIESKKLCLDQTSIIAKAFNDGWGGDTVIEPTSGNFGVVSRIDDFLRDNFCINLKKHEISWAVRFDYLISIMAEKCIYRKVTEMNIMDMEYCERTNFKEMDDIINNEDALEGKLPKVDQKYNYVVCSVQEGLDDDKKVIIALSDRGSLGIKKGSEIDKQIYHYCECGYEDFMTLLLNDNIGKNFIIKSVIKLF